jgi:hypothetical protein
VTLHIESPASESHFERAHKRDPLNTVKADGIGDKAFIHAGVSLASWVDGTVIAMSVQDFGTVEETEVVLKRVAQVAIRELLN